MFLKSQFKYKRVVIPYFMGLSLSICIIFLQVGFTYYNSFQILALVLILTVVANNKPSIVNMVPVLLVTAIFTVFLSLTTFNVPLAISQNSEDVFISFIGVVGYSIMVISAPNIAFRSPKNILIFLRFASLATLIAIVGLICVTDLSLVPFLNRESLILQNTTLIDNYTTLEALENDFAYRSNIGLEPDIDLFYGEQSFLSVVIFTCITSSLICEKLILLMGLPSNGRARYARQGKAFSFFKDNLRGFVFVSSLASMVYIKSFSSFFYALLICVHLLLSVRYRCSCLKLTSTGLLFSSLVVILLGGVVWSVSDYYMFRLSTVSDSLSFEQRFASFFDFGIQEYLSGISRIDDIPQYGFQNGVSYIIGISGLGGVCWIVFLFYRVYILAHFVRLSFLSIMCVLGIFLQNGGVFSPSKVVLLSLVLIPLSCVNRMGLPKRSVEGYGTDNGMVAHTV